MNLVICVMLGVIAQCSC